MKPLVLALAIASALALAAPSPALAQAAAPATTDAAPAPAKPSPAWVEKSNEYAQIMIKAQAPFAPEGFSFFGIPGYDDQVDRPQARQRQALPRSERRGEGDSCSTSCRPSAIPTCARTWRS